jgi:phosphoserine aminotransferase
MDGINRAKAAELYRTIDASEGFYRGHAAPQDRSLMNVVFTLPTPRLEKLFLEMAETAGFYGLAGHRSLGGIRASIYNAVTPKAVDALCGFMEFFRSRHEHQRES